MVVSLEVRNEPAADLRGVHQSLPFLLAGLTEALREFTALVREGMVEREEELRVTLGLDGTHDLVDYVPGHTGGLEPEVR